MFRIDTPSGLHGELVELIQVVEGREALVLVKQDRPALASHSYSTHRVFRSPDGDHLVAEAGHYDLTLDQARNDLAERAGRV